LVDMAKRREIEEDELMVEEKDCRGSDEIT
jgi:hypothetical protein